MMGAPSELDVLVPDPHFATFESALADRYAIRGEIGRGSRAAVYRARDRKRHRSVAIKVLHSDLTAGLDSARFLEQMRRAVRLRHPHIVPFSAVGEAAWRLYAVMPYVEGETLRARLAREGRLPLGEALSIARQVGSALAFAHARRLLHKDLKPENIVLSGARVMVVDFGLSRAITRAMDETMTGTGLTLGTPAYMSPELARGAIEIDARADLYSLGCVLYEMLAGEPPFTGATPMAVLKRSMTDAPAPIRSVREAVPAEVDLALTRLLAQSPAARFPDATRFVEAVAALSA
jgi:eukaryotic-like serine/threonine-protein kinase